MGYCVAADLYSYGLPRGALVSPGRPVESVDASADSFELDGHGFAAGDAVQFRPVGGGTLPAPLVEGTTYYALPANDWRFRAAPLSTYQRREPRSPFWRRCPSGR